jgi:hypothetical protein
MTEANPYLLHLTIYTRSYGKYKFKGGTEGYAQCTMLIVFYRLVVLFVWSCGYSPEAGARPQPFFRLPLKHMKLI